MESLEGKFTCPYGHYMNGYEYACSTCLEIKKSGEIGRLKRRLAEAEEIIKLQALYKTHVNGEIARSYLKKYGVKWSI